MDADSGAELRREVDEVVDGDALPVEGRRLRGERLRRRGALAGHHRLRHRALLDRPHRLAGLAVEDVEERRLARLHHGLDAPAVDRDLAERRRPYGVVLPDVVVHHLEVPHPLAGRGVERDEAVGEEVVPRPVPAIDHAGRRRERHVDVAQFLVGGQAAPGAEVARVGAGAVAPGVGAELSVARDDVERPAQLAGPRVEAADVLRRRLPNHAAVARPTGDAGDDYDVADHDRPRGPVELAGELVLPAEVDPPLVREAERRDPPAGRRVERVQVAAPDQQQPPRRAVRPVGRAPCAAARHLRLGGGERRLAPDGLAGGRVERLEQPERVGCVEHAVDEDRRRPEVRVHGEVGERRLELRVGGRPAPDDLELADVGVIDLLERRVARERRVGSEVAPFGCGRLRGRLRTRGWLRPGGRGRRQRQRQEDRGGEVTHRFVLPGRGDTGPRS